MAGILIIDPDMPTRNRIQEALEAANHRCIIARSPAEGYEIAQHSTRMLVILNARLPWAESFTLLRLLEEKAWPLLFVTADASTVRHLRALYQGPRGVLLAPFDSAQLRHSVAISSANCLTTENAKIDMDAYHALLEQVKVYPL